MLAHDHGVPEQLTRPRPAVGVTPGQTRCMAKQVWAITLYVETDDDGLVEELVDEVARVACPEQGDAPADHACPIPWFVVSHEADRPEKWRELLNR